MNNRIIRCSALILDKDREFLLLIQQKNKHGDLYWWIPGGGLEENETEEEGIRRELIEELGIDMEFDDFFILEDILPNRHYKKYYTWIGRIDKETKITIRNNDSNQIVGYKWFNIKDKTKYEAELYVEDIYLFIKKLNQVLNRS
ncbi:NUDIX hydrolase [Tissierella sp.]|uniref:NUDIX hydrolase n=1 Tax=Tissierella sp. TaxID=41274 RepID=UPI002867A018|nr:NUDIX hydrolase [Tissierella sp.]MDR7856766.1 NUDIX hydrolase [Tissierella sp.]